MLELVEALPKAGRMWGQLAGGQEGNVSGDNRWKGRGNWEWSGLGWPSLDLSSGNQWEQDLYFPSPLCQKPSLFRL